MRSINTPLFVVLALAWSLTACPADSPGTADASIDSGGPDTAQPDIVLPSGVTYHNQIRAIVERRCLGCHIAGGAGPFVLDSWDAVRPLANAMTYAVAQNVMPPWNMASDCRDVQRSRALTAEEKAFFAGWEQNGTPEGDPADYVAPALDPPLNLGTPFLELASPEPYVANKALPDDYRCLPLPHVFAEDTFVTASQIFPDQGGIVHHVILSEIPAAGIAQMESSDALEAGPGYTCFGGPGITGSQFIGGWVPGMQPTVYPEGSAIRLRAGSRLVMQIHYNLLSYGPNDTVPADATSLALWTMPAGQRPTKLVLITTIAQPTLDIPAGEPNSVQTIEQAVPVPVTAIGVIPHMHTLGKSIKVELERHDGTVECLADVPAWDFNWQQYYAYEEDDFVKTHLGDKLRLTCVYDNSPENQPVVNGMVQQPRDVQWGEGTLDEMCLNYIATLTPFYNLDNGQQCDGATACIEACAQGDSECPLACIFYAENDCFSCALDAIYVDCAPKECPLPYLAFAGCLKTCSSTNPLVCAFTDCAAEFDAVYACFEPKLRAGACNTQTQACNFSL